MHLALLLLFWSFLLQWNSAEKKNERFLWSLKYSLNIGYMPDLRWLMGFRSLRKPMHRCLEWVAQGRLFWFPQKIQCVMYLDHSKIENTHNMLRLAIACHESWTPRGLLLGSSGMDWLEDDKDDWFSAKLLEAFLATNNMPPTKQDLPLPSKSVSGSCWRWKTSLKQQKLWSPPPPKKTARHKWCVGKWNEWCEQWPSSSSDLTPAKLCAGFSISIPMLSWCVLLFICFQDDLNPEITENPVCNVFRP